MNSSVLVFDETSLKQWLGETQPAARPIFAAACAQRVLPSTAHIPEAVAIGNSLDSLWQMLMGGPVVTNAAMLEHILAVQARIGSHAEDAVATLIYAHNCAASHGIQDATYAAQRAYSCIDGFVWDLVPGSIIDSCAEKAVRSSPLIQKELNCQMRDATELCAWKWDQSVVEIARIRDRSRQDAHSMLAKEEKKL